MGIRITVPPAASAPPADAVMPEGLLRSPAMRHVAIGAFCHPIDAMRHRSIGHQFLRCNASPLSAQRFGTGRGSFLPAMQPVSAMENE
jgi:hypothetical protein